MRHAISFGRPSASRQSRRSHSSRTNQCRDNPGSSRTRELNPAEAIRRSQSLACIHAPRIRQQTIRVQPYSLVTTSLCAVHAARHFPLAFTVLDPVINESSVNPSPRHAKCAGRTYDDYRAKSRVRGADALHQASRMRGVKNYSSQIKDLQHTVCRGRNYAQMLRPTCGK